MSTEASTDQLLKSASEGLKDEVRKVIPQPRKYASKDEVKEAQERANVLRSLLAQLAAEIEDIRGRYLATR